MESRGYFGIRITEGIVIATVAAGLSVWGSSQVQRVEIASLQRAVIDNTAELKLLGAKLSSLVTLEHRMTVVEDRADAHDDRLRIVERLSHSSHAPDE
jgi:hypothetical protein